MALPLSIALPWIIFLLYWLVSALKTKRSASTESDASRYGVMILLLAGYFLLFRSEIGIGWLGQRFVPTTAALMRVGAAAVWVGLAVAVWARYHLGQYWSSRVTIKEDHQLIRTGPYARLRHPIYTGLSLMAAGTALAIDRWQCLLGGGLIVLAFCLKARKEEAMLAGQFGEAFRDHRRRTGFLLPRVWYVSTRQLDQPAGKSQDAEKSRHDRRVSAND